MIVSLKILFIIILEKLCAVYEINYDYIWAPPHLGGTPPLGAGRAPAGRAPEAGPGGRGGLRGAAAARPEPAWPPPRAPPWAARRPRTKPGVGARARRNIIY